MNLLCFQRPLRKIFSAMVTHKIIKPNLCIFQLSWVLTGSLLRLALYTTHYTPLFSHTSAPSEKRSHSTCTWASGEKIRNFPVAELSVGTTSYLNSNMPARTICSITSKSSSISIISYIECQIFLHKTVEYVIKYDIEGPQLLL